MEVNKSITPPGAETAAPAGGRGPNGLARSCWDEARVVRTAPVAGGNQNTMLTMAMSQAAKAIRFAVEIAQETLSAAQSPAVLT